MKTAVGKLAMLAFVLLMGVLLLAPMRAGVEDTLTASVRMASLYPGETLEVQYNLRTENVQTVAYSSDDSSVAEVDQRGVITAVAPGKTIVRLKAEGGAAAEIEVRVQGVAVTSFALNTKLLEMEKGDVSGLSCVFNDGATDQRVEWISADPEIVTVDAAGRVTAVGSGETYVVATTRTGLSAAATVRVNVRGTVVHIVPGDLRVGVGATFQLGTAYLPEDTTDEPVIWRSSNPQILTVDNRGMVRAISTGTAKVNVTTRDGLVGTTTIFVEPAAKDFQINPTEATIERGESQKLEAWFIGADGERADVGHHIVWSSADPGIARVDQNGLVSAVSSGETVITVSADGFESRCVVHVQASVSEVRLNMDELYLLREQTGEPFQLSAAVTPADADDTQVVYSTNNTMVANVSKDGLVTLTGGYGTAVITATAASGAEATFTVHVVTQLPGT